MSWPAPRRLADCPPECTWLETRTHLPECQEAPAAADSHRNQPAGGPPCVRPPGPARGYRVAGVDTVKP